MFEWSIYSLNLDILYLIKHKMWIEYTVNWYWYYLDIRYVRYSSSGYEILDFDKNIILSFNK